MFDLAFPVLTVLVLLPVGSGIAVLLLPKRRSELVLPVATLLSLLPLGAAGWLLYEFETGEAGFQFVDVKHCHGYLGHELLTGFDRPGAFGGDFEGLRWFLLPDEAAAELAAAELAAAELAAEG